MAENSTKTVGAGFRGLQNLSDNLPWAIVEALNKILWTQEAADPGSINSGATGSVTVTVTGATAGDFVLAGMESVGTAGLLIESAEVTAADTVTIRIHNTTGGAVDLGSTDFFALVVQKDLLDIREIGQP